MLLYDKKRNYPFSSFPAYFQITLVVKSSVVMVYHWSLDGKALGN
jgi:hypothetical protein